MAAQPKNKITSAERGKRRAGNTPKLAKDLKHSKTPLHKKTLFNKFLKAVIGAVTKPNTKLNNKAAAKKQKATDRAIASGKIPAPAAKPATPVAPKSAPKTAEKKAPVAKATKAKTTKAAK